MTDYAYDEFFSNKISELNFNGMKELTNLPTKVVIENFVLRSVFTMQIDKSPAKKFLYYYLRRLQFSIDVYEEISDHISNFINGRSKIINYTKALSKMEHLITDLTQITDLEKLFTNKKSFESGDNSTEEKLFKCNLRIKHIQMLENLKNNEDLQFSSLSNHGYKIDRFQISYDEIKEFIEVRAITIESVFKEAENLFKNIEK